jgi:O-antigen/teichoic acid export membrane protein
MSGKAEQVVAMLRRPGVIEFMSQSGWLLGERILRLGTTFLVIGVVARHVGPSQFGLLSLALTFVALLTPLATLALEPAAVRELVRRPADAGRIVGTVWSLRVASTLPAVLLASAAAAIGMPAHSGIATLAVLASFTYAFQTFDALDYLLQSRMAMRRLAIGRGIGTLLGSAVRVALVLADAELWAFAIANCADAAFTAIFLSFAVRGTAPGGLRPRFDRREARALLGDTWPLVISGFMVLLFMRIDQIMLGWLATPATVGQYAAAVRFVELWAFLPGVVLRVLYPRVVGAAANRPALERLLDRMFRGAFIAALVIVAVSAATIPWLLPLLYGEEFRGAVPVALVLLLALAFMFSGDVRAQALFVLNLKHIHVPSAAIGMGVLVALNVWWIPEYGALGAAAATVLGYAASAMGSSLVFRQTRWLGRLQLRALVPRAP